MTDLKSPALIYAKGILFLFGGFLAAALLLLERPTFKVAVLLVLSIWCFARFYYFAFYVIQHYVDPSYRFAGLVSFLHYLLLVRQRGAQDRNSLVNPKSTIEN